MSRPGDDRRERRTSILCLGMPRLGFVLRTITAAARVWDSTMSSAPASRVIAVKVVRKNGDFLLFVVAPVFLN
jgi:hypothetical protein